jgi:electron transfer flavoprotein beta subunit
MAAKKKVIDIRDFASTGAQFTKSWSAVVDSAPRPARAAGVVVTDDGTAGQKLVNFLSEKKLI